MLGSPPSMDISKNERCVSDVVPKIDAPNTRMVAGVSLRHRSCHSSS